MKTFREYLEIKHPEVLDEGIFDNKYARSIAMGAALAAGGLGLASKGVSKPVVSKVSQEDHDEDFIDDTSSDEGIAAEKAKMLRMAQKVPMKTQVSKGVEVSRGSAHLSGGKIDKAVKKAVSQPVRNFNRLPSGSTSSPDFGGSVD
jgi:hypothetical protein